MGEKKKQKTSWQVKEGRDGDGKSRRSKADPYWDTWEEWPKEDECGTERIRRGRRRRARVKKIRGAEEGEEPWNARQSMGPQDPIPGPISGAHGPGALP